MATWGVTLRATIVAGALLVGCSDDGADGAATTTERSTSTTAPTTTSTAPERPASTTTTAYDPAAVEGQVEAAYLRSWDVYADAVYDLVLDEAALAEVYAGEYLTTVREEISERIRDGRAALTIVEHNYEVQMVDDSRAVVVDEYTNHQVLIDPETRVPVEDDPNERVVDVVTLELSSGVWKVVFIEELQ